MYIVYCQNKPKSEHIVSEYIDTYFEVRSSNLSTPPHCLHRCVTRVIKCPKKILCLSTGPEAAIGPQAADHRPPDQTGPAYYEVPAAVEGERTVEFVMQLGESRAEVGGYFFSSLFAWCIFVLLQDLFKISKKAGMDTTELEVTFVRICTIVFSPRLYATFGVTGVTLTLHYRKPSRWCASFPSAATTWWTLDAFRVLR